MSDGDPDGLLTEQRIATLVQFALSIPVAEVEAAIQARAHEEAVGPLLDPTRYRRDAPALERNLAALRAFLTFRRRLEELRASAGDSPS